MNGGYVMLDLKGLRLNNVSQDEFSIPGIYKKAEEAFESKKPVFLYNTYNLSAMITPIPCSMARSGANFRVVCEGITDRVIFNITSEDIISG